MDAHVPAPLALAHALGALDEEERGRVEVHAASCPPCAALLAREAAAAAAVRAAVRSAAEWVRPGSRSDWANAAPRILHGAGDRRPLAPRLAAGGAAGAALWIALTATLVTAAAGVASLPTVRAGLREAAVRVQTALPAPAVALTVTAPPPAPPGPDGHGRPTATATATVVAAAADDRGPGERARAAGADGAPDGASEVDAGRQAREATAVAGPPTSEVDSGSDPTPTPDSSRGSPHLAPRPTPRGAVTRAVGQPTQRRQRETAVPGPQAPPGARPPARETAEARGAGPRASATGDGPGGTVPVGPPDRTPERGRSQDAPGRQTPGHGPTVPPAPGTAPETETPDPGADQPPGRRGRP